MTEDKKAIAHYTGSNSIRPSHNSFPLYRLMSEDEQFAYSDGFIEAFIMLAPEITREHFGRTRTDGGAIFMRGTRIFATGMIRDILKGASTEFLKEYYPSLSTNHINAIQVIAERITEVERENITKK